MPPVPSHSSGVLRDEALRLMLSERGAAVVPVTAGETSMVPHLEGGDAVLAVPVAAPPAPGDLLLYRQQDYWVVHRCLGRATAVDGRTGFRTRGDGRNVLDPHLASENVLARVVAVRRGGTWRSLDGSTARVYASCMVWHDLCWAAAGVVARKAGLGSFVAALDLGALRLAVPIAFPLFHRRIPPPHAPSPDETV
jgi:hypothetical protein